MYMSYSDMTYAWFDVTRNANDTWPEAHCVIALWRHYYHALSKFYCRDHVKGHFSGYPSHKTYTCHYQHAKALITSKGHHYQQPCEQYSYTTGKECMEEQWRGKCNRLWEMWTKSFSGTCNGLRIVTWNMAKQ